MIRRDTRLSLIRRGVVLAIPHPPIPIARFHPRWGEVAGSGIGEDAVVSLCRHQLRTLRAIERDLADSDPGLDVRYQSFARQIGGQDLRWVEKTARGRLWPWRHEPRPSKRMKDWCAENRNDP